MPEHPTIRRALISVYDKTGIIEFARALHDEFGVEIISTGGTAGALRDAGIPVTLVEQITGFPEMLGGRVKTLHPRIHAAILADRDNPEHVRQLAALGIQPIDMVVVNLYPFKKTVADPHCTFEQAIEMIDIGGPCLLRAAAKNHRHVLVLSQAEDCTHVLTWLRGDGPTPEGWAGVRRDYARRAYECTSRYDAEIVEWLTAGASHTLHLQLVGPLRYGENPGQTGRLWRPAPTSCTELHIDLEPGFTRGEPAVLHHARPLPLSDMGIQTGCPVEMSFNNWMDASAAYELCVELTRAGAQLTVSPAGPRIQQPPVAPRQGVRHQPTAGTPPAVNATPTIGGPPAIAAPPTTGAPRASGAVTAIGSTPAPADTPQVGSAMAAVCFIKHTNACAVAVDRDPVEAYRRAYLGDPNAAMGGILAVNFGVHVDFAAVLLETYARWGKPLREAGHPAAPGGFFVEVWIAPWFSPDAVALLRGTYDPATARPLPGEPRLAPTTDRPQLPRKDWGPRVRLLAVGDMTAEPDPQEPDYKRIAGGMLVQTRDLVGLNEDQWQVVTKRPPTEAEMADLRLAWLICKHTKSNAITICKDGTLLGNGAGQMSRVMSCRIATWLAQENGHADKLAGAAAASDAFFPFRDGPDMLMDAGITAIIQPGGGKRDAETIAACDERGRAMVFTGTRHFRH